MSPITNNLDKIWELAKGSIIKGSLCIDYDFTEGKTKDQFIEDWERKDNIHPIFISKSGRLIIPSMGIL